MKFKRSSKCDSGTCIEVAVTPEGVYIRNSQEPNKVLWSSLEEWRDFRKGIVEKGDFDF